MTICVADYTRIAAECAHILHCAIGIQKGMNTIRCITEANNLTQVVDCPCATYDSMWQGSEIHNLQMRP